MAVDCIQVDETEITVKNDDRHKAVKEYIWIVGAAVPRLPSSITTTDRVHKKLRSGF